MQTDHHIRLVLHIKPTAMLIVLLGVVLFLGFAHASVHAIRSFYQVPPEQMFGLYAFFDLGSEANLPTYVSAFNLLLASFLLGLIAVEASGRQQKYSRYWWGLMVGFLVMSVDEIAQVHDGIIGPLLVRVWGQGEGILYFRWYQLYLPVVLIIGLVYIPFLRQLPVTYLLRFTLAGVVFVGGAVGFEMVEAYLTYHALEGESISQLFEETGEMLAVVWFIHSLLLYLKEVLPEQAQIRWGN